MPTKASHTAVVVEAVVGNHAAAAVAAAVVVVVVVVNNDFPGATVLCHCDHRKLVCLPRSKGVGLSVTIPWRNKSNEERRRCGSRNALGATDPQRDPQR
jgi:hypothetical protein